MSLLAELELEKDRARLDTLPFTLPPLYVGEEQTLHHYLVRERLGPEPPMDELKTDEFGD